MIIDNILLERSPVHGRGVYVLHIESAGNKFFAVRAGLLKNKDARATREIVDVPVRRQ